MYTSSASWSYCGRSVPLGVRCTTERAQAATHTKLQVKKCVEERNFNPSPLPPSQKKEGEQHHSKKEGKKAAQPKRSRGKPIPKQRLRSSLRGRLVRLFPPPIGCCCVPSSFLLFSNHLFDTEQIRHAKRSQRRCFRLHWSRGRQISQTTKKEVHSTPKALGTPTGPYAHIHLASPLRQRIVNLCRTALAQSRHQLLAHTDSASNTSVPSNSLH